MSEERDEQRVRAVIVNFNGSAATLSCVLSLLSQHHRPLDVVVVDNASAADDLEILRAGLAAGTLLVASKRNLGYAGGVNLGARSAELPRPRYVLALNNDLLFPDPHMVTALIAALGSEIRRVAASPLVDTVDTGMRAEEQIQVRRVPGFWTLLVTGSWWLRRLPGLRRGPARHVYKDQRPYQPGVVYEVESINGSCFLIRADFLEEIGYLDEGTFLYYEELILGLQILERGRIAALTATTRVIHRQGRTTGHGGERIRLAMLKEMVRSEIYYCKKYLRSGSTAVWLLLLVRTLDIASKMAARPLAVVARRCAGALR
jgi:GT2 family glycosyltransferase